MKMRSILISVLGVSAVALVGCTSADMRAMVNGGDAVATSNAHRQPTHPENIKVHSTSDIPKHYQVIGRVSAQNDNLVGIPRSQASILAELKKQAASLGATGIINLSNGMTQTTAEAIVRK